ncbi:MAG TPA: hypothetical protein DCG28_05890 [Lachnospiraceae bacterium]|nr:hypothetical protein [Lachnospiraceae bacterium]
MRILYAGLFCIIFAVILSVCGHPVAAFWLGFFGSAFFGISMFSNKDEGDSLKAKPKRTYSINRELN